MTSPQQPTGLPSTFGNSVYYLHIVAQLQLMPSDGVSTMLPVDNPSILLEANTKDLNYGFS